MLTDEERDALVKYRIDKAFGTLVDARDCAEDNHWTLSANRLILRFKGFADTEWDCRKIARRRNWHDWPELRRQRHCSKGGCKAVG